MPEGQTPQTTEPESSGEIINSVKPGPGIDPDFRHDTFRFSGQLYIFNSYKGIIQEVTTMDGGLLAASNNDDNITYFDPTTRNVVDAYRKKIADLPTANGANDTSLTPPAQQAQFDSQTLPSHASPPSHTVAPSIPTATNGRRPQQPLNQTINQQSLTNAFGPFNRMGMAVHAVDNHNGWTGTATITKDNCSTSAIDNSISRIILQEHDGTGAKRTITAQMGKDGQMHADFISERDASGKVTAEFHVKDLSDADRQKYASKIAEADKEANATLTDFKQHPNAAKDSRASMLPESKQTAAPTKASPKALAAPTH